ncbi:hypothetical protein, partial [Burkholderia anthinoferrum]|uniref:hypothetical protein n=1 Tax=Burkholderia anthinoferrum TaxID=3090833 RepID=UPI001CA5E169
GHCGKSLRDTLLFVCSWRDAQLAHDFARVNLVSRERKETHRAPIFERQPARRSTDVAYAFAGCGVRHGDDNGHSACRGECPFLADRRRSSAEIWMTHKKPGPRCHGPGFVDQPLA